MIVTLKILTTILCLKNALVDLSGELPEQHKLQKVNKEKISEFKKLLKQFECNNYKKKQANEGFTAICV